MGSYPSLAGEGHLEAGARLGRYVIGKVLGSGNMGVVYAAFDPELDRTVAIKLLTSVGSDLAESGDTQEVDNRRLLREAQAIARLAHPNIVKVHDVGTADGRVFIAMEHIDGETVRAWYERVRPSFGEVVNVFQRAALGLAHAHDAGLVHRDFKPDNIMVDGLGRVVVTDFGLALPMGDGEALTTLDPSPADQEISARTTLLSRTGALVGTPAYMAPELLAGASADARSDQFAFCISLYEALYGERPFEPATARLHVRGAPPRCKVPQRLRRVVLRGLSEKPSHRFTDMRALAAAFRRRRLPWPLVAGGAVATVSAVAASATGSPPAPRVYCDTVATHLEGVWDDDTRDRLREAFASTKLAFSVSAADNAIASLDAYANQWVGAQTDACQQQLTTSNDGSVTATMACLAKRRASLEALVGVVTQADARIVTGAADALARLPEIDVCTTAVAGEQTPPPELADRVAALDKALRRAHALRDTGLTKEALEAAQLLLEDAKSVAFAPMLGAAETTLGDALADAGRLDEAENAYHRGLSVGVASQHHRTIADASAGLASAAEERDADSEVERWVAMGNAALDAAHDPDTLRRVRLLTMLGVVQRKQVRLHESEATYRAAIRTMETTIEESHVAYSALYSGLGLTLSKMGEHEEASEWVARARKLLLDTYGENHPQYAAALQNTAAMYLRRGAYAQALQPSLESHATLLAAFGPKHPSTGTTAYSVAVALLHLQRYDEAHKYAGQAMRAYEPALGADSPAVAMVLALSGEIDLRAGDLAAAESSLEQALRIATRHEDDWRRASYLSQLGRVAHLSGDLDTAKTRLSQARALQSTVRTQSTIDLAETVGRLAALALDGHSHPLEALPLAKRSWDLYDEMESDLNVRADAALLYARALMAAEPTPANRNKAADVVGKCLRDLDRLGEASTRREALTQWLETAAHAP